MYASELPGAANLRLQSASSNGLPNLDSLELIGGGPIPPPQLAVASMNNGRLALQVNGAPGLDQAIFCGFLAMQI